MNKPYDEVFEIGQVSDDGAFVYKTKVQIGEIPAGCDVRVTPIVSVVVQSINSVGEPVGNPVSVSTSYNPHSGIESLDV